MKIRITAIIVTYNRKKDLLRCINAVLNQARKPDNLLIINNCSTDGTEDELKNRFNTDISLAIKNELIYVCGENQVQIFIVNESQNIGGSGGFCDGMKFAHENLQSDYFWLMDDDGYPTENCLEQLLGYSEKYDYIMPTSIDIDNHEKLSWQTRMRNGKKTSSYEKLQDSWGEIMNYVTPFNGVLLSKKCVASVGYINREFFLWGDEYEHYWRCVRNGFAPVTLLSAKFYHPAQKLPLVKICFDLFSVPYVDSPLRMICLARNYTYIYRHYNQKYKIPIKWVMYWWLFIITRRGDFEGWKLYKQSVKDGFKEDFTRHFSYLK